jgi:hypothetical protein
LSTDLAKACFRYGPRIGAILLVYIVAMLEGEAELFEARGLRLCCCERFSRVLRP